jgi:predicted CoA-binding protein
MGSNEMKSFYKELEKAKKTLIKNLWIQKDVLDDEWFREQISTKEYVVRDEELKRRIKELEK